MDTDIALTKALVFIGTLGLVVGGITWAVMTYLGPCHRGYYRVDYVPAYTTTTTDSDGDKHIRHHPERCSRVFVCDERCKDVDKQLLEAHPEHETIMMPTIVTSNRCDAQGRLQ